MFHKGAHCVSGSSSTVKPRRSEISGGVCEIPLLRSYPPLPTRLLIFWIFNKPCNYSRRFTHRQGRVAPRAGNKAERCKCHQRGKSFTFVPICVSEMVMKQASRGVGRKVQVRRLIAVFGKSVDESTSAVNTC